MCTRLSAPKKLSLCSSLYPWHNSMSSIKLEKENEADRGEERRIRGKWERKNEGKKKGKGKEEKEGKKGRNAVSGNTLGS